MGRQILPLDKYIAILVQLGEVTSKTYILHSWCDVYSNQMTFAYCNYLQLAKFTPEREQSLLISTGNADKNEFL